nr:50S ribosomal protein L11 methyltransferase [uncultured Ruminococcus sp.]
MIESSAPVISKRLKQLGNYKKGGNKGFDTCVTRLQSQGYVIISDFVYMRDKFGKPYGWGVAEYSTPEAFMGGSFTEKVQGKFDIVLANIVADAIIFLSKGVRDFMKHDAVYIMSGIIDTRADEVKAEVSKYFDIIEEHFDGGWVVLVAKRKDQI